MSSAETVDDGDENDWLTDLGVTDTASGNSTAVESLEALKNSAFEVLGSMEAFTNAGMLFCGLVARSQGLHQGAMAAIEASNPYSTFTVIRAYAETSASVLYAIDHPKEVSTLLGIGDRPYVAPGRLINHMQKKIPSYKSLYNQLSQYSHPASSSFTAGFSIQNDGTVNWSSTPSFRDHREVMIAYGWITEIARNTALLFSQYADAYNLRDASNRWA